MLGCIKLYFKNLVYYNFSRRERLLHHSRHVIFNEQPYYIF